MPIFCWPCMRRGIKKFLPPGSKGICWPCWIKRKLGLEKKLEVLW